MTPTSTACYLWQLKKKQETKKPPWNWTQTKPLPMAYLKPIGRRYQKIIQPFFLTVHDLPLILNSNVTSEKWRQKASNRTCYNSYRTCYNSYRTCSRSSWRVPSSHCSLGQNPKSKLFTTIWPQAKGPPQSKGHQTPKGHWNSRLIPLHLSLSVPREGGKRCPFYLPWAGCCPSLLGCSVSSLNFTGLLSMVK